jgi:hypothetical protein
MQTDVVKVIDPSLPREAQTAALRRAIEDCYCGLGPACYGWRQMSPEEREDCSQQKRMIAQRLWKNGM